MGDEWFLEFVAATRRASGGRWRGGFRGGELRAELRRDGLRRGRAGLASRGLFFGGRGALDEIGETRVRRTGVTARSSDKMSQSGIVSVPMSLVTHGGRRRLRGIASLRLPGSAT